MIIKLNILGWEANVVTNYFLSFQASNDTRNASRKIDLQIASFVISSSNEKLCYLEATRDYDELLMINQLCERLGLYQQIICCSEKLSRPKSALSWDLIKDAFTSRLKVGKTPANASSLRMSFMILWKQSFRWYFSL